MIRWNNKSVQILKVIKFFAKHVMMNLSNFFDFQIEWSQNLNLCNIQTGVYFMLHANILSTKINYVLFSTKIVHSHAQAHKTTRRL